MVHPKGTKISEYMSASSKFLSKMVKFKDPQNTGNFSKIFFFVKKVVFIRYFYRKNTAMTVEVNIEVYIEILIFHFFQPKIYKNMVNFF